MVQNIHFMNTSIFIFFLLLSDVPADGNEPDVVVYAVVNKTKQFNAEFISENVPLSKKGKVLCV